ncbi:MAG: hypothetical protein A2017_04900 [Lentisphaerae bacterium GWF2_44_16]|nr:MAG: hypothetical protein A2017_04900 [Lentisphaerae bacterium GWF2_44_16]
MSEKKGFFLTALLTTSFFLNSFGADPIREIIFNADSGQRYMTSKLYKLDNVKALDIAPWVSGAVKRNCPQASVEYFPYEPGKCSYITVSMTREMVSFIDDMIKKMDRPGKTDKFGSIINGTDVSFFSYSPQYRASQNMADIVYKSLQKNNAAFYLSPETNVFYWKDAKADGENALAWLKFLDRPVPQAELNVKTYEFNENDLIDLGIDYIHWKNGPGLEMFGIGADITSLQNNEAVINQAYSIASNFSSGWGGFLVAPQFDASFVRMLQQRGKAKVASSGSIRVVNHSTNSGRSDSSKNVSSKTYSISFTPSFQNITKDESMKMSVVSDSNSSNPQINLQITDPTIFFPTADEFTQGDNPGVKNPVSRLYFDYNLVTYSSVQRDVMGTQSVDRHSINSSISIDAGTEKLIGSYSQEYDVYENIGIPFLKDVPILKYLFSVTTRTKEVKKYYVTVHAAPAGGPSGLSDWAGKVLTETKGAIKEVEEDLKDR